MIFLDAVRRRREMAKRVEAARNDLDNILHVLRTEPERDVTDILRRVAQNVAAIGGEAP